MIRQKLTDLNVSSAERLKLANEYNKTADESNKIDVSNLDNTSKINELINNQIELLKKRAFARAAEAYVAEKAEALFLAQEKARQKNLQLSIEATQSISGVSAEQIVTIGGKQVKIKNGEYTQAALEAARQKSFLAEQISKDPAVVKANEELNAALNVANGLVSTDGLTTNGNKSNESSKRNDDQINKLLDDARKLAFEKYKITRETDAALAQAVIDDDKSTLADRLKALEDYSRAKRLIIDAQAEYEISTNKNGVAGIS